MAKKTSKSKSPKSDSKPWEKPAKKASKAVKAEQPVKAKAPKKGAKAKAPAKKAA